ncbi:MAG: glycerophosphodiester phosphodiesterase [Promethearchaeota archaeon]|nr:MAG: glycerophosphodiester phosphodiesterase [Candidatus Lokiarchaeota archaeon]
MSWQIFQKEFQKKFEVMIIGHRGAFFEATQNTIRAFELAVECGAEMVEFDVHSTKDGHVVIIHDRTTEKVSDVHMDVQKSTLAEVQKVPLHGGHTIPTLDELFKKFKGKLYFQIEIKQAGIASEVLSVIDKHDLYDQCIISSFNHDDLASYRDSKKSLLIALLQDTSKGLIKKTLDMGMDGIHPEYNVVTPELVSEAHSNNLFVNTWTADRKKSWEHLIRCGVDGIMTNNPRKLHKFLKSG